MNEQDRIRDRAEYKFKLIKEFYNSSTPVNIFCKDRGIKRRTFYRWLKKFNEKSYEGLIEKSKRPKKITQTPDWVQDIIVELSQKIGLGSKNISNTLEPLFSISHTGVLKILRKKGITIEVEKKRWQAFRSPYKNHTWQIDFLGPYTTNIGEISILVILDDYSRYSRSKLVKRHGTTNDVTSFLDFLIKELSRPYRILTDNGTQFRKTFDRWCIRKGIKHHKSRVRHPQTLGKVEALNKTLGRHFRFNFRSISEGQINLDTLMEWYNHIHYHSVIQSTPAAAYGIQKDKMIVLKNLADKLDLKLLKNKLNNCAISGFT